MATTITQRWRFGPGAFAAVAKHARHVERVSDEHLMRRVQAGDRQAFGELYDRHCGQAFGFALKICDTRERAEEAVQDAFLCLWRTRARYDPTQGRVQTWLLALVRNRSIDMYRRHVRHNRVRASETTSTWRPPRTAWRRTPSPPMTPGGSGRRSGSSRWRSAK